MDLTSRPHISGPLYSVTEWACPASMPRCREQESHWQERCGWLRHSLQCGVGERAILGTNVAGTGGAWLGKDVDKWGAP